MEQILGWALSQLTGVLIRQEKTHGRGKDHGESRRGGGYLRAVERGLRMEM